MLHARGNRAERERIGLGHVALWDHGFDAAEFDP